MNISPSLPNNEYSRCRIACHMINSKHEHPGAEVMRVFADWVKRSKDAATAQGFKLVPTDVAEDPDLNTMEATKELRIYTGHLDHPCKSPELGLDFRFIHDWHHVIHNIGFAPANEVQLYNRLCGGPRRTSSRHFAPPTPRIILPYLRSEIAYQACVFESTADFLEEQKVVLSYPTCL